MTKKKKKSLGNGFKVSNRVSRNKIGQSLALTPSPAPRKEDNDDQSPKVERRKKKEALGCSEPLRSY